MNYRHAFHAGNFADVVKHAVLCRMLVHLREKPAAFRVIDTHAGAGRYDLAGAGGGKTGEWRDGIGRLLAAELAPPVRTLLAPYLDAVAALNPGGRLTIYPGSPALAQALLRRQDRLIACELEPHAAAALERDLRGDPRAKAIAIDGWTALTAYVPPVERRGIVLIDPPFEQPDEFSRLLQRLGGGASQMADRHLPALVPDQGPPPRPRPSPAGSRGRHRENVARGTDSRDCRPDAACAAAG